MLKTMTLSLAGNIGYQWLKLEWPCILGCAGTGHFSAKGVSFAPFITKAHLSL